MKTSMLAFLLIALTSVAVHAADSPKDVQALIGRGDYAGAEAALRQAVSEHPSSAKAHYVLAEVLAHEGNIGEAKSEANKAASLDPATHFTDPAKFQHFQRELDAALAPASRGRSGAPALLSTGQQAQGREGGSSHLTGILIAVVVIALIAFFWTRRRRDAVSAFNGYPPPPPMNGAPPYGGGYPGYAPPPSSGVGTAVAAGLGGLAAGALLDEAFRSHREGEASRDVGAFGGTSGDASQSPSSQAYDDLRNEPIDMGNDDSSWGDSSSGDGGDFDDNQW